MAKPMREAMPQVSAFIDELRRVFVGADGRPEPWIAESIRRGMAGEPVFHAVENGNEVGTPNRQRGLTLDRIVIGRLMPDAPEKGRR